MIQRYAIAVLLSMATISSAAESPRVTGIYSDMRYIPQAGDVIGTEVHVLYARDKFYVLFQNARGEPDPPILVPASVNGSTLAFEVPSEGRFTGTVSATELTGRLGATELRLSRGKSYWE